MDRLSTIKTSEIIQRDWTIKRTKPRNEFHLRNSVQKYGVIRPLHVYRKAGKGYVILDGARVLRYAQELGIDTVTIYDHANISDAEAKKLHLHLNINSFDIAEEELAELIHGLVKDESVNQIANEVPLDKKTVKHYVDLYDFIFENYIKVESNQASLFG